MLRNAALGLSIAIVFALVVVMMANVMPAPLRQIDYMVIGSVATLVSMSVLFLALIPLVWLTRPQQAAAGGGAASAAAAAH